MWFIIDKYITNSKIRVGRCYAIFYSKLMKQEYLKFNLYFNPRSFHIPFIFKYSASLWALATVGWGSLKMYAPWPHMTWYPALGTRDLPHGVQVARASSWSLTSAWWRLRMRGPIRQYIFVTSCLGTGTVLSLPHHQ
jgi:hypothetical protein